MDNSSANHEFRFRTNPFRVSRVQMAYITAEEYIRSFWWFVGIVPCFGVLALIWGHGNLQIIGLLAILWPISIPARAILTTAKSAKLFDKGVWIGVADDGIYVHGTLNQGLKLGFDSVRDSVERQGHVLVRTTRLGFLPIRAESIRDPETAATLRSWLSERLDLD